MEAQRWNSNGKKKQEQRIKRRLDYIRGKNRWAKRTAGKKKKNQPAGRKKDVQ